MLQRATQSAWFKLRILWCLPACCLLVNMAFSQSIKVGEDTLSGQSDQDVVVTASRVRESWLRAPAGVQKADRNFFARSSSPDFYQALESLKGVQMITPSLGFRIINTRGFAHTTNVRFAQLVDGMDVQSPHIGSPIGNALGPSDLDIERVEIVPGVAATLYGMNAINGIADMTTRNAFDHQGLSIMQRVGVSHLGNTNTSARVFGETSLRYARSFGTKWAIKTNLTYTAGYDWIADNYTDLNANANISTGLTGSNNPGSDPVNSYGNESPNNRTLTLGGLSYVVARTGYEEKAVTDYGLQNLKGDATLYYRPRPNQQLSYTFRGAQLDNVYQRANRFRLSNYFVQQHALQYQTSALRVNVYLNAENTGSSYNLRSMAENIDRAFKSDNRWFADYSNVYNSAMAAGASVEDAHLRARAGADAGRYQPGTPAFADVQQRLQNINNWDSGAALRVRASFVQADAQWNLTEGPLKKLKERTGLELLSGIDHRTYAIQPDGNYFVNPEKGREGNDLFYSKTGFLLSAHRNLIGNKLRLGAALRADKSDFFPLYWSPRFTAVYSPTVMHNIRASWQVGYRFPIIFEGFSNVNSGGVKRVGGLPVMSSGIFENAWLQSSIAGFQAAVLRDMNSSGLSRNEAITRNSNLLKKNPYTYLQPERVRSAELGYRGLLFKSRLIFDADFYFNKFTSFIAQANMNVPNTAVADSVPFALYERSQQAPYRMWTNSTSAVYNYGFSAGATYRIKTFLATASVSHAKLAHSSSQDGLEDGFNTPPWMVNASLSNPELAGRFGAGISWRWQSSFYWQSFLVSGNVPAYSTVDAHVSFRASRAPVSFKLGGSNIFNRYYYSFLGGPSIGAFYYCTVAFGKL